MKRLLKKESNITLSVDELTANANYLYRALEDLEFNRFSYSGDQDLLIWKSDDGKNVLIDGYHRLVEGIVFDDKDSFNVKFVDYDDEHKEYIDEYEPSIYDDLTNSLKYKGLEELYDINKIESLKEKTSHND